MGDVDPKIVRLNFVTDAVVGAKDAPEDRKGGVGGGGSSSLERAVEFSDDGLALEFSHRHHGDHLYVATLGKWISWDGRRWKADDTENVLDLVRKSCRDASLRSDSKNVASAKTISAVGKLASRDRAHAETWEAFDADDWKLNTPNGIIDLRKGEIMPHDRNARMSLITGAGLGLDCPVWRKYLSEVTAGDVELEDYLQRIAGYCLTGSICEHKIFILVGTGLNGKSIFLNTLLGILGDYGKNAPMDVFCVSRGERHPTELAMLKGARLVTASEVEEGRRWDEGLIKSITGGDVITARHMRQDFFEFHPKLKLLMAVNHLPGTRSVDVAMRRRLSIIPFTRTIANPDQRLPEKLRQEWSGILAWAVQGCLEWQKIGLSPPAAVKRETERYFEMEDAQGKWLQERCRVHVEATATTRQLYADWRDYAQETGEYVGSERRFSQHLEQRGFTRRRDPKTGRRGFQGIGLITGQSELALEGQAGGEEPPERHAGQRAGDGIPDFGDPAGEWAPER